MTTGHDEIGFGNIDAYDHSDSDPIGTPTQNGNIAYGARLLQLGFRVSF